jgi:acylphosphatase
LSALPEGWKTVRLIINGRVQGVSYRWWTVGEATKRGLNGWVRNRRDGSVEVLVSGLAAEVDDLIEACRQGPSAARVTDIAITQEEGAVAGGFEQRPTV